MRTLEHEIVFRGEEAMKAFRDRPITVCGAGAIGSNLVDNMVRQGFETIRVIDDDRVDAHNLHTQIWQKRDVGLLKTQALNNHVFNVMKMSLDAVKIRLTESSVAKYLKKGAIVIDGFDNAESRKIVSNYCKDNGIDCLHIGLYQNYAEVIWNEKYVIEDDSREADVCEYPLARNVILLAVSVATEVLIRFIISGAKEDYTITLGDFKVCRKE
jgi:molybdopterin/thiamine biosynthesis adenylyltransferase